MYPFSGNELERAFGTQFEIYAGDVRRASASPWPDTRFSSGAVQHLIDTAHTPRWWSQRQTIPEHGLLLTLSTKYLVSHSFFQYYFILIYLSQINVLDRIVFKPQTNEIKWDENNTPSPEWRRAQMRDLRGWSSRHLESQSSTVSYRTFIKPPTPANKRSFTRSICYCKYILLTCKRWANNRMKTFKLKYREH